MTRALIGGGVRTNQQRVYSTHAMATSGDADARMRRGAARIQRMRLKTLERVMDTASLGAPILRVLMKKNVIWIV